MLIDQFSSQFPARKPNRHKQRIVVPIISLLGICLSIQSSLCLAQTNQKADNVVDKTTFSINANANSTKLEKTHWWHVAKNHQLDPYVLYAVALIESAKSSDFKAVTPWPLAINKSGKAIIPATKQEAQNILNKSLAEGNRQIDIGMMQINLRWHGHRVDKPEHLLNPVTNLEIGAQILSEAIQSVPNNLVLGIGRYHSWQNVPAAVEYGKKVIALAEQIRTLI
jgi:soluble lytic murein transglycosylase-like protein